VLEAAVAENVPGRAPARNRRMIDLHLHTSASDGTLSPAELIARAACAGLTVVSVTDHDTIAALKEAGVAANAAGLTLVTGIEITAVEEDQDVHILGYFFDPAGARLTEFLRSQRADRLRRVHAIADRLRALGCEIDTRPLAAQSRHGNASVGRPHVADALIAAGHAIDRTDAFDRLIGRGRPAFIPRTGASAIDVISLIGGAGGIASLAHPGPTGRDELVPQLAAAGLTALEARHSDHDAETETHYRHLAAQHGLAVSGGSDFHGDGGHHALALGIVTLPAEDFAALRARVL
jgi:predicted metal-dependent phosphoesterase TrpH